MPVKEPALLEVNSAPFIKDGINRCRTWPVAVLKTMTGWGEAMSRTAAVLLLGFRATALARTGEPSSMILPAGVNVWLSDTTMEPSLCGPTVRLAFADCGLSA